MGELLPIIHQLDSWIQPLCTDVADDDARRVPTRNIVRVFVRLHPQFQPLERELYDEMRSCEYYLHREAWLEEIIKSGL